LPVQEEQVGLRYDLMIIKHYLKLMITFMENKIKFFMILIILFASCSKKKSFKEDLSNLSNKYDFFDVRKWQIDSIIHDKFGTEYRIKRSLDDKLETAFFFVNNNDYRLYNYQIKYESGSYNYFIRIDDFDTAYFFKQDILTDSIIFLKGYYTYLYQQGYYSPGQLKYYFDHRDSLDNIRGHNLPELPKTSN
jgi:hypothetical protein